MCSRTDLPTLSQSPLTPADCPRKTKGMEVQRRITGQLKIQEGKGKSHVRYSVILPTWANQIDKLASFSRED